MVEHSDELVRLRARIARLERCVAAHAGQEGVMGQRMLEKTLEASRAREHELETGRGVPESIGCNGAGRQPMAD